MDPVHWYQFHDLEYMDAQPTAISSKIWTCHITPRPQIYFWGPGDICVISRHWSNYLWQHRKLYTRLYNKPTYSHSSYSHSYLHFSCHPHHRQMNTLQLILSIKSMTLTLRQILQNIVCHYRNRGYPVWLLQGSLDKVKYIPSSHLFTNVEEEVPQLQYPMVCIMT